jgi:methylmalonyl-CoA mutase C-terminal domain/subunit
MSGAHMTLFPAVLAALKQRGAEGVVVFGGGIIPRDDQPILTERGFARIYTPGATTQEIVEWVETVVRPRAEAS